MERPRNSLSQSQFLQAADLLRINRDRIEKEKWTAKQIASWATVELKFNVTDKNISTVCKTVNPPIKFGYTHKGGSLATLTQRVADLERRMDDLCDKLGESK